MGNFSSTPDQNSPAHSVDAPVNPRRARRGTGNSDVRPQPQGIRENVRFFYDARPVFQLRKVLPFDSGQHVIKLGLDLSLVDGRISSSMKLQPSKKQDVALAPTLAILGGPMPDVFLFGLRIFAGRESFVRIYAGWCLFDKTPAFRIDVRSADKLRLRTGAKSSSQPYSSPGIEYDARWSPADGSMLKLSLSADLPRSGSILGKNSEPLTISCHDLKFKQYVENNPLSSLVETFSGSFKQHVSNDQSSGKANSFAGVQAPRDPEAYGR